MQDERLTKSLFGRYRISKQVPKESEGNNQLVYIQRVLTSTVYPSLLHSRSLSSRNAPAHKRCVTTRRTALQQYSFH